MEFALRPKPTGLFLDLAPLIDMVFLLLIFFMISSRFFRPVIDLELPQAKAQSQADQTAIIITIDQKGLIFLDNKAVPLEKLASKAKEIMKKKDRSDIILQADKQVPFQLFVKTMEQLRKGGAATLNIETTHYKGELPSPIPMKKRP